MNRSRGSLVAAAMLFMTSACAPSQTAQIEPARCRDLPPMLAPARLTEVVAAAATVVAAADRPGQPPATAPPRSAVYEARQLLENADSDPFYVAFHARSTDDTRRRRELATEVPKDRRLAQLESAFQQQSLGELEEFLGDWRSEVQPRSAAELARLSPAERSAYALFAEFMRPGAMPATAGDSGSAPALPRSHAYVVVPTTLGVSCVSAPFASMPGPFGSSPSDHGAYHAELNDFRPLLDLGQVLPLYLSADREAIITSFLGGHGGFFLAEDVEYPARTEEDAQARARFWQRGVPLEYSHWGARRLASEPLVDFILNEDMTVARIEFQVGTGGGTVRAEVRDGRWVVVESLGGWIE